MKLPTETRYASASSSSRSAPSPSSPRNFRRWRPEPQRPKPQRPKPPGPVLLAGPVHRLRRRLLVVHGRAVAVAVAVAVPVAGCSCHAKTMFDVCRHVDEQTWAELRVRNLEMSLIQASDAVHEPLKK